MITLTTFLFFLSHFCMSPFNTFDFLDYQAKNVVDSKKIKMIVGDSTIMNDDLIIMYFTNINDCQRCLIDIEVITQCVRENSDSNRSIKHYIFLRCDRDKEFELNKQRFESISPVRRDDGNVKNQLGLSILSRMAIFSGTGNLILSYTNDQYNSFNCSSVSNFLPK